MAIFAILKGVTFAIGDQIKVFQKILEGEKARVQPFEGVVISIRGEGENKTFTVRKIGSAGIGIERIWPLSSPWIEKVKVLRRGRVRRAKLYYLRHQASSARFIHEEEKTGMLRRKPRPRVSRKKGV